VTEIVTEDPVLAQARRVHAARVAQAARTAQLEEAQRVFAEQHRELVVQVAAGAAAVKAEEHAARELALERYAATGDKHPAPGLGIRMVKTVEYEDGAAFAWAKGTGLALQLDRKAFEKIALATPIPGATVVEVAQATIASDLSAVLPAVSAPPIP
jgi:hypothetical protein